METSGQIDEFDQMRQAARQRYEWALMDLQQQLQLEFEDIERARLYAEETEKERAMNFNDYGTIEAHLLVWPDTGRLARFLLVWSGPDKVLVSYEMIEDAPGMMVGDLFRIGPYRLQVVGLLEAVVEARRVRERVDRIREWWYKLVNSVYLWYWRFNKWLTPEFVAQWARENDNI